MSATLILGLFLVLIEPARSIPAWLRIRHHGSAGVSETATALQAGTAIGWIVLALASGAGWLALATGGWCVAQTLILIELWRSPESNNRTLVRSLVTSVVLTIALIAAAASLGAMSTILGLVLGGISIISRIPMTHTGLCNPSTRGLSVPYLTLSAAIGYIYLVAGLGFGILATNGDFVLGFFLTGAANSISFTVVLSRVTYRRLRGIDHDLLHIELHAIHVT